MVFHGLHACTYMYMNMCIHSIMLHVHVYACRSWQLLFPLPLSSPLPLPLSSPHSPPVKTRTPTLFPPPHPATSTYPSPFPPAPPLPSAPQWPTPNPAHARMVAKIPRPPCLHPLSLRSQNVHFLRRLVGEATSPPPPRPLGSRWGCPCRELFPGRSLSDHH